jgi:hypothetical protein
MHKGWTQERVDAVEREYRRFLYLMKKYPDELTAPSMEVDRFWHQHILDTMKYARDCESAFGYFLHHYPYLGLGLAGDDAAAHQSAGERMCELYEEAFEEPYRSAMGYATNGAAGQQLARNDAAWCTRAVPSESAWCTKAKPTEATWCTKAMPTDSAWCTKAVPVLSAWCTKAMPTE